MSTYKIFFLEEEQLSNDFQIGKEIGELRARLLQLENKMLVKTCSCADTITINGAEPIKVHPDDEKKEGVRLVEIDESGGSAALTACSSRGTTKCIDGICHVCCNGKWSPIKVNGITLSCPIPAYTYQVNCGGSTYWVGGCSG